ncbi:uncharacterized protein LOC130629249 [Hydractinia symbiolongicarpus]|uniref:uncharacterized protein LOC130629249 n=1 Tax=Hydractinia symbiolongicarpus TaxID=13093 RepID=UPI0025503050|nr:uncharacterized protein LOC130629249 [Hydractinia symbiolongicarpus]
MKSLLKYCINLIVSLLKCCYFGFSCFVVSIVMFRILLILILLCSHKLTSSKEHKGSGLSSVSTKLFVGEDKPYNEDEAIASKPTGLASVLHEQNIEKYDNETLNYINKNKKDLYDKTKKVKTKENVEKLENNFNIKNAGLASINIPRREKVENVKESTLSEQKDVEETSDEGGTAEDKRPSQNDDEKDVKKLLDITGRFSLKQTTSPRGRIHMK